MDFRFRLLSAALCLSLSGCQVANTLPAAETDGSYWKLPDPSTRAVVWGTHSEAVRSLKTWLLKQGYVVVDELKIGQLARENNSHVPLSHDEVLKLAKMAGAKEVIFVDAEVATWRSPELLDVFVGDPIAYKVSLFIRALNVETGEIDWNGKALSTEKFRDLNKGMHYLTCNALATGWGLQKSGVTVNGGICPAGQNVMVVKEDASTSKEEVVKSSTSSRSEEDRPQ
jgi:hypothetical protein